MSSLPSPSSVTPSPSLSDSTSSFSGSIHSALQTTDLQDIIQTLLQRVILRAGCNRYRLAEIEFYLFDEEKHPDPFVHCDENQRTFGHFYFHRQNGKSYKGGTYKGLDITFGEENVYGGMLIRAMVSVGEERERENENEKEREKEKGKESQRESEKGEVVEGPCNVVNRILRDTNCESIEELVTQIGYPDISSPPLVDRERERSGRESERERESEKEKVKRKRDDEQKSVEFCLEWCPSLSPLPIYRGPRVGLTLRKDGEKRRRYLAAPYRFLTFPSEIRKNISSVYCQAVLDSSLSLSLSPSPSSSSSSSPSLSPSPSLFSLSLSRSDKYIQEMERGKTDKRLPDRVASKKSLSVSDLCAYVGFASEAYTF